MWIDARLALWLEATRSLIVADLHWGYVESHRAQGNLLPAWGDADIAARLRALLQDYQPAEMIWLGDSLHTLAGRAAAESFLQTLSVPVVLVSGNHDVRWTRAAETTAVRRGGFFLHHGDQPAAVPQSCIEIVGHHHPAFVWSDGAGTHLKLPALVASPRRFVLPAFSPWAAGMPWKPAGEEIVYGIGTKRIFTVSGGSRQKEPFV
ncbi:metallophosphoesterase [Opitutus terrae]|uniref:Metallophosphoesterase n=1 Tax=Opitutus terrae (strain DSM 11246 / JCM 15787 / PB90-1) TaxID=452637 RepID=B1ZZM5_OPITP|nr:metallophosphoesterase [Opitutus terrae]ACB76426.1 metallophosphoesterase [Opitutus terrae PB90-1]